MSLSIGNTVATLATGSLPSSVTRTPSSSAAGADPAAQGLKVVDMAAGLAGPPASAWKVIQMTSKLGSDANDIATTLVSSMQALILQRPDLANAQFDFSSDNGTIKVTSSAMSADDQAWLQGLLNSNHALTSAVQTFHDDTVAGYAAAAAAKAAQAGQPPPDASDEDAGGANVDVNFMALFRQMGADTAKTLSPGDTLTTSTGAKVDMSQDPGTAVGLLGFMQSAQALAAGTVNDTIASGRTFYDSTRLNVFADLDALPNFFSDTSSLGMHVTA